MKGIKALAKKLVSIQEKHIVKIMFKNEEKLIKMREHMLAEKKRLGRTYESEYECITVLQRRLRDIFDEFQQHYLCLNESETCFKEFKFLKGLKDKNNFELLAFTCVHVKCRLDNVVKPSLITIKNSQSYGITIEVRSEENYFITRCEMGEGKEYTYQLSDFNQPYFVKIVVCRPKTTGNMFNAVWNNESKLGNDFHTKYSLKYFLNPNFSGFIQNETKQIGQGFGLTTPSTERVAESTLENHILPSHKKDSQQYIDFWCNLVKKMYITAVNNSFEDTPYLKIHLIDIIDKYFDSLGSEAQIYH